MNELCNQRRYSKSLKIDAKSNINNFFFEMTLNKSKLPYMNCFVLSRDEDINNLTSEEQTLAKRIMLKNPIEGFVKHLLR